MKVEMITDSIGIVHPTWCKKYQRIEVAEDTFTTTGRVQLKTSQRGYIVSDAPDTFNRVSVHIDGIRHRFNNVSYHRLIPLENEKSL